MQTSNAPTFETEPEQFLCMLSFTDDGAIQWSSAIGAVTQDFIQRMVHIFRASVSMSSAFLKVADDSVHPDYLSKANEEKRGTRREATSVRCDRETMIFAKQTQHDNWFGFIGRPFALRNDVIVNEVLNTLGDLATILFPTTGGENSLHKLCQSISALMEAAPFWNDRERVGHLKDSLVTFAGQHILQGKQRSQPHLEDLNSVPGSSIETALNQPLEAFHAEIFRRYGATQVRLCVFNSEMRPVFAQKLSRRDAHILGWYFSTCLNVGFPAFSNIFLDVDNNSALYAWYKRSGLILFSHFLCTMDEERENPSKSFRKAADSLIDAVGRATL